MWFPTPVWYDIPLVSMLLIPWFQAGVIGYELYFGRWAGIAVFIIAVCFGYGVLCTKGAFER